MKSSHRSLLPSERKIIERITDVRKTADLVSRSKRRFSEYRYLRSVLRAYQYLADKTLLTAMMEIAPAVLIVPARANWHPLRVLIEATMWTQIDYRTRSRWTRALQYAIAREIDPDQLPRFIRANNGIAGCAELASKTRLKRGQLPTARPASKRGLQEIRPPYFPHHSRRDRRTGPPSEQR